MVYEVLDCSEALLNRGGIGGTARRLEESL